MPDHLFCVFCFIFKSPIFVFYHRCRNQAQIIHAEMKLGQWRTSLSCDPDCCVCSIFSLQFAHLYVCKALNKQKFQNIKFWIATYDPRSGHFESTTADCTSQCLLAEETKLHSIPVIPLYRDGTALFERVKNWNWRVDRTIKFI